MIPMLIIGHVFAIRSDWPLCREVQVNFAYRWFGGLSVEDKVPDHSAFSHACNERFGDCAMFRSVFERVVGRVASAAQPIASSSAAKGGRLPVQRSDRAGCLRDARHDPKSNGADLS